MNLVTSYPGIEVGQRFGRLTVLGEPFFLRSIRKDGTECRRTKHVVCQCECGIITVCCGRNVKNGHTQSCGCIIPIKHGFVGHPIYKVWEDMIQRCTNPNHKRFKDYGGRGITICETWEDAKTFIEWCLANGWKEGLEIDRKDNDGNYEPSNCHFVPPQVNCQNRRNTKLSDKKVRAIRALKLLHYPRKQIAELAGVHINTVDKVLNGKIWDNVKSNIWGPKA